MPEGFCPHCGAGRGSVCEQCGSKGCEDHFLVQRDDVDAFGSTDPWRRWWVGRRVGDCVLGRVVGSGGLGSVFRAYDADSTRRLSLRAVKLLHIDYFAPEDRWRRTLDLFEREVDALDALSNHPNVVRLISHGEERKTPFLVMEFLECPTLGRFAHSWLAGSIPPPNELIRRILDQVLGVLEAAHGEDIVHRDLKPANVLVCPMSDDQVLVKVVDLGLAKFVDEATGTVGYGTKTYMAPEQVRGHHIGPWTDFFAMGVMALVLLARCFPYQAYSLDDVDREKAASGWTAAPVLDALALPDDARVFFDRALERDHRRRFGDAVEFRRALHEAIRAIVQTGWVPPSSGTSAAP